MKVATWNVNGIRAREQEYLAWAGTERPDVVCLQELKAPRDKVPAALCALEDYWCLWHGERAYSGVGLLLRKEAFPEAPEYGHPPFDHETRIVTARTGGLLLASVYVPNGGKDFDAKLRFLEALAAFVDEVHAAGLALVLGGDINVARTPLDVHEKERREVIGQLPLERELLEALLARGLVDVGRMLDPDNAALFTWWAPWRNLRQRNIGWRIDYVLASRRVAATARASTVRREVGTSDHAPVVVTFEGSP
jgi:exodeoxyribonuclease-3